MRNFEMNLGILRRPSWECSEVIKPLLLVDVLKWVPSRKGNSKVCSAENYWKLVRMERTISNRTGTETSQTNHCQNCWYFCLQREYRRQQMKKYQTVSASWMMCIIIWSVVKLNPYINSSEIQNKLVKDNFQCLPKVSCRVHRSAAVSHKILVDILSRNSVFFHRIHRLLIMKIYSSGIKQLAWATHFFVMSVYSHEVRHEIPKFV